MAIKSARTLASDMQQAAEIDCLLAELAAGEEVPKERVRKVLAQVRGGLDIPSHYLSDEERADLIINAIQGSDSPLEYARMSCTQDFFGNALLPHGMRQKVAQYLVGTFGARGNPMWQTYLSGTFRFIDPQSLESEE